MSNISWKLMENVITIPDKIKLVKFILTTDKFTNGDKVKELENEWNKWLGSKHSLFVSSGSTANFLLIAAIKEMYGLKSGDKVLVPACTWMTNVAPIMQLGLTPIFCDIQFKDFSFDHSELNHISRIHPDIKLIFVTHLLGYTSTSRTSDIFFRLFPHALVIDDVCESHGCLDNYGDKIGANSLGATFSTYWAHHISSCEGGFVSTNNTELYDLMKMKRSHGMARESLCYDEYAKQYPDVDKQFLFITDGYNFRNTEIGAVLGISQLKQLTKNVQIRNENHKMFADVADRHKTIFYGGKFRDTSSSFCFPMIFQESEVLEQFKIKLRKHNIEYRPIVSGNLLRQPFLRNMYLTTNRDYPTNVDILHEYGIYLGNNQFVNEKHFYLLDEILGEL